MRQLNQRDPGEALGYELSAGLAQRGADGPGDEAIAACCFSNGSADLGVAFALRSSASYRAKGNTPAANRVLAAAARHADSMTPSGLSSLARARARVGELELAAETVARAAERARQEGCVERALEFCLAAARWHAPVRGVHRTWCLALIATGDPDGALGHLVCWARETSGAWDRVRPELEAACGAGRAADLIARARRVEGPTPAAQLAQPSSRAFLAPGLSGRRETLVRVLTQAGIEVVEESCERGFSDALVGALPLDLVILPIGPSRYPGQEFLENLRAQPGLEKLPILGALAGELDVDRLEALRLLGLAGVIDLGAAAEHILFRVERVLRRSGLERRVHTRIPASFDVSVERDGVVSAARADSLSSGGLRLRCARALDVNDEVRLRFHPEPDMATIRANARVVNCLAIGDAPEPYAIGVFFLDLTPSARADLDALVARRLADADAGAR